MFALKIVKLDLICKLTILEEKFAVHHDPVEVRSYKEAAGGGDW